MSKKSKQVSLIFTLLISYNSSELVGSEFGGTWEDPWGVFFEFAVKRALKQDQIVYMDGKLQVIFYFSRECVTLGEKSIENIFLFLSSF